MSLPWENDHGLSHVELERALTRELDLPMQWIAEGWDCDVLSSAEDPEWLFKVPKRKEVVPWIEKESRLLRIIEESGLALAPRVRPDSLTPKGSRTPSLTSQGLPVCPYPWIAISVARGVSLKSILDTASGSPSLTKFGHSYGAAIRELHDLSSAATIAADLAESLGPRPKASSHGVNHLLAGARLALPALTEFTSATRNRLSESIEAMELCEPVSLAPVFVHDDLYPEHVFLDPDAGTVTQFIDWADAGWGDPAADFAVAAWSLGNEFLDAALRAYGNTTNTNEDAPHVGDRQTESQRAESFRGRIRRLGLALGLYDIHQGLKGAPNISVSERRRALRRRIDEGWLDDYSPQGS